MVFFLYKYNGKKYKNMALVQFVEYFAHYRFVRDFFQSVGGYRFKPVLEHSYLKGRPALLTGYSKDH